MPLQVGPLEVGTVQAGAGPGRSISKKTVDLHYTIDEQDSDEFPLRCELENFEDLKQSLRLLLGFKRDNKVISVVLVVR